MMRAAAEGRFLVAGDPGYDKTRAVWNAMVDRRPWAIVRCTGADEVAEAIRYGRQRDLEIGVRCGGHSVLGLGVPDDGLMIDLTPMAAVRVDPERRRARVQGGALLGALDHAAMEHGLTTTAGNVSHTGVGGLTLGGGMGWLARQHGLTCDNVESYELITAEGERLRVDAESNPDLFWGLRGGGGNFGIVTEFEFRLQAVARRAHVVELFFGIEDAAPVMRGWRDLNAIAPRAATFTAWVGESQSPLLPPEWRGRPVANVGFVWAGEPELERQLLPALRALGRPIAERVEELSYLELQRMDDTLEGHALRRYWKGHYFQSLPDEAIDAFLLRGTPDGHGERLPAASLQAYGGAIAEVPDTDSAFSQRNAMFEFVSAARWSDPGEDEDRMAAARRYAATLEPFATGMYVNAMSDEGATGVARAYTPAKLARLRALKGEYDPDNVFHLNQNIQPA
jgi:FAD/FMN-containing dehydrogenase